MRDACAGDYEWRKSCLCWKGGWPARGKKRPTESVERDGFFVFRDLLFRATQAYSLNHLPAVSSSSVGQCDRNRCRRTARFDNLLALAGSTCPISVRSGRALQSCVCARSAPLGWARLDAHVERFLGKRHRLECQGLYNDGTEEACVHVSGPRTMRDRETGWRPWARWKGICAVC
jgi:hypothetical protein